MRIRIVSIILTFTTLLSLMISCATEKQEKTQTPSDTLEYDGIVIDNEYNLVRADISKQVDIDTVVYLRKKINSKAKLNVGIKSDYSLPDTGKESKEILVGKTNRKLDFDRTTLKEDGDYYIGIEGNRIIIDAYDSVALRYAVEEFVSKWLTEDLGIQEDGTLLFNEEICAKVNGLSVIPQSTIKVLSQNMYYSEEGRATRMQRFQQLIDKYDPDLIGTQETTNKWLNDFKNKLGNKYGVIGCSRDGRNATGGEWNAVLYRLDRFELIDSDTFWLSSTPDKKSAVSGSKCYRICTWALLKDKQTNRKIVMANTHLDHGTDQVREQQAEILVNYFKNKYANYPIFITGDFNCEPNSLAYKTITNKWLDAHQEVLVNRATSINTFSTTNPVKEIDFCFHSNRAVPLYYYIINEKIQNGYVSDHFGVLAEFALK